MKLIPVIFLLLAPLLTSCMELGKPVDCSDVHQNKELKSGVNDIQPAGASSAVKVYCDMDSEGGGWTVFQRRMDGTVNFYRGWDQYKRGFGDATGEYWLSLDNIYHLTSQRRYELRVDMEDFDGKKVFARYSSFTIGSECDGYTLRASGFTDGGAGDSLMHNNGHKFSTFDNDQDSWKEVNCAQRHMGAFWYDNCVVSNPNGVYLWGKFTIIDGVGVFWWSFRDYSCSLKAISLKIRPVQ